MFFSLQVAGCAQALLLKMRGKESQLVWPKKSASELVVTYCFTALPPGCSTRLPASLLQTALLAAQVEDKKIHKRATEMAEKYGAIFKLRVLNFHVSHLCQDRLLSRVDLIEGLAFCFR